MPNLKDLKNRIASVKSTRKITKAMQMVAAAKLRRAQEAAEASRPYSERFNAVMEVLKSAFKVGQKSCSMKSTSRSETFRLAIARSSMVSALHFVRWMR